MEAQRGCSEAWIGFETIELVQDVDMSLVLVVAVLSSLQIKLPRQLQSVAEPNAGNPIL